MNCFNVSIDHIFYLFNSVFKSLLNFMFDVVVLLGVVLGLSLDDWWVLQTERQVDGFSMLVNFDHRVFLFCFNFFFLNYWLGLFLLRGSHLLIFFFDLLEPTFFLSWFLFRLGGWLNW